MSGKEVTCSVRRKKEGKNQNKTEQSESSTPETGIKRRASLAVLCLRCLRTPLPGHGWLYKNSFSKVTEAEASLEGVEHDRDAGVETVKCGLPSLPLNKEELRSIDAPLS